MKTVVTFEIDADNLGNLTDTYLAQLWHIAQANPAPMEDASAGKLAEYIGREIVRRFLANTPPDLWSHQGHHAYWAALSALKQQRPDLQIQMPGAITQDVPPEDEGRPVPDPKLMALAPAEYTDWEKRVWCRGHQAAVNLYVERELRA